LSRQNNYELFANVFSNLPTPAYQIFLNFYEIFVKIFVKTKTWKSCQTVSKENFENHVASVEIVAHGNAPHS